jgi:hypothetical protein
LLRAGWKNAGQEQLKANLAGAEELLNQALAYMPNSKRANYFLGRFYLDNGQQQRGKAILQQHGLLLEALRFKEQPVIDGVLDDAVWAQAVVIDTFYQYGFNNAAAYPSTRKTRAYVGHNSTALFIGMRCEEAHPESILVASRDRDSNQYNQDMVEFFFDANLDRESYVVMFVNSTGAITDAWSKKNEHDRDLTWNSDIQLATHVGPDFWSVECKLNLGQPLLPKPRPGDLWGFNLQRAYRGAEWNQWTRTYNNGTPRGDTFGYLLFD